MPFDLDKKNILGKQDKSKKQSWDQDILDLMDLINEQDNYFTTSSCSGRISLFRAGDRKDRGEWLFVTHQALTDGDRDRIAQLLSHPPQEVVWLRAEPFILHVACRDLDDAKALLKLSQAIFKRSSILSLGKNLILEVRCNAVLDMPISDDGELKVSPDNLHYFLDQAHAKLVRTKQKTAEFFDLLRKEWSA